MYDGTLCEIHQRLKAGNIATGKLNNSSCTIRQSPLKRYEKQTESENYCVKQFAY